MEQKKEPRKSLTQSTDLWQKTKGNEMEQWLSFKQMVLEQLDIYMQKN